MLPLLALILNRAILSEATVHRESKYAIEMIALIMSEIFNDTF